MPKTWDLEISFADELDEMWGDELWDLGAAMDDQAGEQDEKRKKWWILKPGMADRGMGIRMFNSKEALQEIFEGFEEEEEDEEDGKDTERGRDEDSRDDTAVVTSQLRHFVIQVNLFSISTPTHKLLRFNVSYRAVGIYRHTSAH